MNSGLGRLPDLAMFSGTYDSPRRLVEALEFSEPEHALRETPAYANTNFEILGQLIEQVSGKTWSEFLSEHVWTPLGMNRTFGSIADIPSALRETSLNAGHLVCDDNVVAMKYDGTPTLDVSPGYTGLACGSIVSSPNDMTKLLRLLLNKGKVDGVTIFKSPSTIADMITGKNLAVDEFLAAGPEKLQYAGIHFAPEGETLSAGYGFDMVGNVMWGHAYYEKGGDTYAHHAKTSYAPYDRLAVAVQSNTQGRATTYLDQIRSYVMGIFFDIPKDILEFEYDKWRAYKPPRQAPLPGAPVCGLSFWKNPPHLAIDANEAKALVGEYTASQSTKFFPRVIVSPSSVENEYIIRFGMVNATLFNVGNVDTLKVFMMGGEFPIGWPAITFQPDPERNGSFILNIGVEYRKQ